jgi:transposase
MKDLKSDFFSLKENVEEKKKQLKVGIDVHKSTSVIYALNEKGERVRSKSINTCFEEFKKFFSPYLKDYDIQAAVETGNLAFWLSRRLEAIGISVYVVNTLANKLISGSSKKTDKRDAGTLALQLLKDMLPEKVYAPNEDEQNLRSLVQHRKQIVKSKTRVTNRAHALLLRNGIFVSKANLKKYKKFWVETLEEKIPDKTRHIHIEFKFYMEEFDLLNRQLQEIEQYILEEVDRMYEEENNLLMSIPGVGFAISSAALAYGGDGRRFENTRRYQGYWGQAPGHQESAGKKLGNGGITKVGPSIMRGYLTQGALSVLKHKHKEENRPLYEFYEEIRKRKGWKKARVALGRKISSIMYGVLKNRTPYDPRLLYRGCKEDAAPAEEACSQSDAVKR